MNKQSISFAGAQEMSDVLRGLSADLRAEILARAVDAGAVPIVTAAKRLAPVKSGALRESLTHVVRKNRSDGTAYAIIGPDRNYYLAGVRLPGGIRRFGGALGADRPANYAHLVEFGHSLVSHRGGRGKSKEIGHVPARPFLRPAVMAASGAAAEAIARGIDDGIDRAISRRVKTRAA